MDKIISDTEWCAFEYPGYSSRLAAIALSPNDATSAIELQNDLRKRYNRRQRSDCPGLIVLKSKFYPVDIDRQIIYADPCERERDVQRSYQLPVIAIKGKRIWEHECYRTFVFHAKPTRGDNSAYRAVCPDAEPKTG